MILKIDFHSEVPIYIQLKNQIIQGIAQGDILEGEGLPSVRQLAEDIGINMHTVNKTYSLLKSDGIIKVDRRRGAVVSLERNNISEEYRKQLKQELMPLVAEAHCRGMSEEEFSRICMSIFKGYKEGRKDE